MARVTKSEKELIRIMRNLEYPESETPQYDEKLRTNGIIITYLAAHENNCADDMLKVIKKNKNKNFHQIIRLLKEEGFFPQAEIVDDDELDDDER